MSDKEFKDAKREIQGILAGAEKKTLTWLAERMPRWINSDHLTVLGLLGMFLAGLFFYLSRFDLNYLHLVNISLAINWFGDSLDGTVARVRNHQRPRYGYYVDHICDVFGINFYMLGMTFSGLISMELGIGLLLIFLTLSANTYLQTQVTGVFKLSFGWFGTSELRILLAIANLAVWFSPNIVLFGMEVKMMDTFGLPIAVILSAILLYSIYKTTSFLYNEERIEP